MDFQKNEFEIVVQKEGDGRFQNLAGLLSPSTIVALEATEKLYKPLENVSDDDIMDHTSEDWSKLSPEDRIRKRFLADNRVDDERARAAHKYSVLTNKDTLDLSGDVPDFPDDMFSDMDYGNVNEEEYYQYDQSKQGSEDMDASQKSAFEEKERAFERAQEEERRKVILEEIRIGRAHEADTLEEKIRDVRQRVGLLDEKDGITEKEASRLITELREDSVRYLKQLDEKEMLLNATPAEIQEHEEKKTAIEKEYAGFARILFDGAEGIESQIKLDMDKFVNGKEDEGVTIDRSLLRDEIRKFKLKPGVYNFITDRVKDDGQIDEKFQEREALAYSKLEKAHDKLSPEERAQVDLEQEMEDYKEGGRIVRDQPVVNETSNTSTARNDIPWTEEKTTTRTEPQRRSYRSETPIVETLSDSISRSVELQKERAEAKMHHQQSNSATIETEAPQQEERAPRFEQEVVYEQPKRRGFRSFFSFFKRDKSDDKGINDYYEENVQQSVFGKEKPENYYEFRATARGLAERGMYLGGASDIPLLPPKEEQMREVNRVRGLRRKIRAYVQTKRFRVSVKVAAYCAFTIGLSMMGGESSIENREQYAMAFISMFGGLLLMNSIREDGIDLPAMPFGPPRKSEGGSTGSTGGRGTNRF